MNNFNKALEVSWKFYQISRESVWIIVEAHVAEMVCSESCCKTCDCFLDFRA